jgi:hypothetical protein
MASVLAVRALLIVALLIVAVPDIFNAVAVTGPVNEAVIPPDKPAADQRAPSGIVTVPVNVGEAEDANPEQLSAYALKPVRVNVQAPFPPLRVSFSGTFAAE